MKQSGFPKSSRLTRKKDFEKILTRGERAANKDLSVWWFFSGDTDNRRRLGIIVSRKNGNSPARNRLKRLLRETFRLNKETLKEGLDIIVRPKPSCGLDNLAKIKEAFLNACAKAGLLKQGDE